MVELMKKDRCGNADMVLSDRKGEECQDLKKSDILNEADSNVFIKNARGFTLPTGTYILLFLSVSIAQQFHFLRKVTNLHVKISNLANVQERTVF